MKNGANDKKKKSTPVQIRLKQTDSKENKLGMQNGAAEFN